MKYASKWETLAITGYCIPPTLATLVFNEHAAYIIQIILLMNTTKHTEFKNQMKMQN